MLDAATAHAEPIPLIELSESRMVSVMRQAFENALIDVGEMSPEIYGVGGICGRKFRLFLNNIIRHIDSPRYLEIGIFKGATLCAAIDRNRVSAVGIDNWSEYGGPATEFYANLSRFKHKDASVTIIERDFRAIPFEAIGKFNILFYDGSHSELDQYDGVRLPIPAMDQQFVLLVDDWNWERVQNGTNRAILDLGLRVDFSIALKTSDDGDVPPFVHGGGSHWHNGLFAAVLSKTRA